MTLLLSPSTLISSSVLNSPEKVEVGRQIIRISGMCEVRKSISSISENLVHSKFLIRPKLTHTLLSASLKICLKSGNMQKQIKGIKNFEEDKTKTFNCIKINSTNFICQ